MTTDRELRILGVLVGLCVAGFFVLAVWSSQRALHEQADKYEWRAQVLRIQERCRADEHGGGICPAGTFGVLPTTTSTTSAP